MLDCMMDIETLGKGHNALVFAIGAVMFDLDTGEIGDDIYLTIDVRDAKSEGMLTDKDTINWWKKQSTEAQKEIQKGEYTLREALQALRKFFIEQTGVDKRGVSKVNIWGNGPSFDSVHVRNAYRLIGEQEPWNYYNEQCVRTMVRLGKDNGFDKWKFDKTKRGKNVHHRADDDCIHQIHMILQAYAWVKNPKEDI